MNSEDQSHAEMIQSVKRRVQEKVTNSIDWTIEDEAVIGVQIAVMMDCYIDHWWKADFERFQTLAVEQELIADVVNPETGRASTVFDHCSKQDGFAFDRQAKEKILIEHKSTSDSLNQSSPYWRKLAIDSQVSKYILSARQAGDHEVRTCLYDVCKKPTTKPKRVIAADVRRIAEEGTYHGFNVPEELLIQIRQEYEREKGPKGAYKGKLEECMTLYGLRLRRLVSDEPEEYFGRSRISRTDDELLQYSKEIWEVARQIRHQRKSNITPKNTSACYSYGTACEFFPICCGEAVDQGQYETKVQRHVEIEKELPDGGLNILTNSRINLFLTCPEKHRLRYEEGLRKVSDTVSTPLRWGSIFHEALEIVWKSYSFETGEKL